MIWADATIPDVVFFDDETEYSQKALKDS